MRFPGIYRATVFNNEDPEYRGRLRLFIPSVFGTEEATPWALPCFPTGGTDAGVFMVPAPNEFVWVMFEGGDPDVPVWLGSWYPAPGGSTNAPREAVKDEDPTGTGPADLAPVDHGADPDKKPPRNYVIRTPGGATIELDDTEGQLKVKIADQSGKQFILLRPDANPDGPKILIRDNEGQYVILDSRSGNTKIEIKDKAGDYIKLDGENGKITIYGENDVDIFTGSSVININAPNGTVNIDAGTGAVNIDGGNIKIDGTGTVKIQDDHGGSQPIARVGDLVEVGAGSSAGTWPIVTGSGKATCGG